MYGRGGWATAALKWMLQTKGIPGERGKSKGAAVLNHKPTKVPRCCDYEQVGYSVSQAGHAESASEARCWLNTVRSEESLCS